MINFYAEWCRYSADLSKTYEDFAAEVSRLYPEPGRVVVGKLDCDAESEWIIVFHMYSHERTQ